jgi:predicted RNase H-like nuclease
VPRITVRIGKIATFSTVALRISLSVDFPLLLAAPGERRRMPTELRRIKRRLDWLETFVKPQSMPPGRARDVTVTVTGIDGCAGGWVAVTLTAHRAKLAEPPVVAGVAVAPTLGGLELAGVTGIDMPLGLLGTGWRDADVLARRALGRRGVTVFAIPPRPVWECETYADANRSCRELTGKGFSVQAWGLRRKVAEADEYRRRAASTLPEVRLHEVHPELSFAAMAGAPLADGKHTKTGLTVRRELLATAGMLLPRKVAGAAEDDLLDAAAVAWSARRIAANRAVVLTSQAQLADDGTEIAIRY